MNTKKNYLWWLIPVAIVTTFFALFLALRGPDPEPLANNNDLIQNDNPEESGLENETPTAAAEEKINFILSDLSVPWEIIFLPDESILVTERSGSLIKLKDGIQEKINIDEVLAVGEGGLLGMALHPDFTNNNYLYLYFTNSQNGTPTNKIVRYQLGSDPFSLSDAQEIISGIPSSNNHNGGRIAFGPDQKLYVTIGDAGNSSEAQNRDSLAGKILRLNDDGSFPEDNPFLSAVWSYGHRNPQGLAWDDAGRLWAVEHGRSGAASGLDEINLIEAGKNYGWPTIEGDQSDANMVTPALHSGASTTWAPASLVYYNNHLYFGGLRGEALYSVAINPDGSLDKLETHLKNKYGRLRIIKVGPDNFFYLGTSNQDGRGRVRAGDDKIIKMALDAWK